MASDLDARDVRSRVVFKWYHYEINPKYCFAVRKRIYDVSCMEALERLRIVLFRAGQAGKRCRTVSLARPLCPRKRHLQKKICKTRLHIGWAASSARYPLISSQSSSRRPESTSIWSIRIQPVRFQT